MNSLKTGNTVHLNLVLEIFIFFLNQFKTPFLQIFTEKLNVITLLKFRKKRYGTIYLAKVQLRCKS